MKHYVPCLMLAVLLAGCDSQNKSTDANQASPKKEQQVYALQSTSYKWPPPKQNNQIAAKLLTKNYYLVLDGSGSMSESTCAAGSRKINIAKVAVAQFISQIPVDANVGLLIFDINGVGQREPLGLDRQAILHDVATMEAGGSTPLRSAINVAYRALTAQAQAQLGYGEYHLVVITDGEADGDEDPGLVVHDILDNTPIVLHTIGFCIKSGHSLNIPGMTDYRSANNPEELRQGLSDVLAESTQYTVDTFKQEPMPK